MLVHKVPSPRLEWLAATVCSSTDRGKSPMLKDLFICFGWQGEQVDVYHQKHWTSVFVLELVRLLL